MKEIKHNIKRRVWFYKWYRWATLILFILLLLCVFLKCCTRDNTSHSLNNSKDQSNNIVDNNGRDTRDMSIPVRRAPIDPEKIEQSPDDPLQRDFVNDLINVYLQDTVDFSNFYNFTKNNLSQYSIIATDTAEAYKRIQFQVDKLEIEAIISRLRLDTLNVKYATYEWILKNTNKLSVNDPEFSQSKNSWFYEKIEVFDAWNKTMGDSSIKIAVLDDGFDLNHKDLKDKYILPWNTIAYSDDVFANPKTNFHGTHVAGTIIAESNNNFGISGVAPKCQFIPIQISDESGYITTSSILDGFFYALKNEADIINISLGFSLGPEAKSMSVREQQDVIDYFLKDEEKLWDDVFYIAEKSNTVIVQAAGNDAVLAGIDPMKRSENSIVVGALNDKLNLADFTNHGSFVDIYAPGEQIYSTLPNNKMGYLDGTSMASPIVAGCVALIKSYKPNLSAKEIIDLVKNTANKNNVIDLKIIFKS